MESKEEFLFADEVLNEFGLDEEALRQFEDSKDVRRHYVRGLPPSVWNYRRDELQALVDSGKIDGHGPFRLR